MPIRNPFKKVPTAQDLYEQNTRERHVSTDTGFHDANVRVARPVDIKEPVEYKLSEINNSGVFVPPSPPAKERTNFFSRTSTSSTQQSTHRSHLSEDEPFNISRESFDSYRRSFDISARSPISVYDAQNRGSLDSRRQLNPYSPRASLQERERKSFQRSEEEPDFEDVGLHDDGKPQAKKRGFLSRLGDITNESRPEQRLNATNHNFLSGITGGRKRGQSGGNELKSIVGGAQEKVPIVVTEIK